MAQPMKVSILIGADASGAVSGGAQAEVAIDGVTEASQRAAGSLDAVAAAAGRAGAGLGSTGSEAAAYGKMLDDLRAKFNPLYATIRQYKAATGEIRQAHQLGALSTGEMSAALVRERQATLASIDAIKGRNAAIRAMPVAANGNVQAFQTANIAAQFQDIGVSIAGGMSPLQIALQQGTQLSSVFTQLRSTGVGLGASLLSAFGQVISPISLVTIGVIALGAAAIQYFTSSGEEVRSLDEVLSRHAQNIRDVKDAYGDAADGLREYVAESRAVLLANIKTDMSDATAAVLEAAQGAYDNVMGRAQSEFAGPIDSYRAFAVAAEKLRLSIAAGTPDILSYRDAISKIAIDPAASESQRTLALELRTMDEEAIKLARSLSKMGDAVSILSGASQRGFLVSDENQRQAAAEALTTVYLQQKAAIDELYKSGVTSRGILVTNAEQLLKLEQALTDEYRKQRSELNSRGFLITDKERIIEREKALTDTYLRQQAVINQTKNAAASFEAQRLQAAARSPDEKADAARAVAGAQVTPGEDAGLRAQRIELAGKQALENAERELTRAQEDRGRALQASIAAQEFELSIVGKSVAEQQRLRSEYQQIAALKEQAARTNTQVDTQEVDLIKQKSAEYAKLASAIAGQYALKSQTDDIDKLRLEISLVGASADVRARSLAAYEAEKQIRDQGIASISAEADAIRANAQVRADLQMQLERQQAAYQSVQQAGGTMIDQLTVGTGTLKDRLKAMAETLLTTFQQLTLANPLKNMLTGTNLPTLTDLFSGKSASPIGATTTAAMTVTAGTVMINGVPMAGLPSPTALTSATAAANQNVVNGVRPDVVSGALVNTPVAANQNVPANLSTYAAAIRNVESGGNYSAIGPLSRTGDRPYGAYQIMGNNVPQWSQQALGRQITPQEMLADPAAQDAIFANQMQGNLAKYGNYSDASSVWHSGRPLSQAMNAQDGLGTKTPDYVAKVNAEMTKLSSTTQSASTNVGTFGTGALDASKALSTGGQSITSSVTSLSSATAEVPAQSQGLFSSLFSSIGKGLSGLTSGIGNIFSSLFSGLFADGAAFSGGVMAFASGGVVSKPTMFPMSGGRAGLMGEAGPEAIMPLTRGAGGRLGVSMVMPRQVRQAGEMRMSLSHSSVIQVVGAGDKELQENLRAAYREELDQRDRAWEAALPSKMNDVRMNPWARTG